MNPSPDRYAVIGNPIAHSRSPQIHAEFARLCAQSLVYDRLQAEPDTFVATVERFFQEGGLGLNVTVPFKEAAWQLAAGGLSERARRAGAVNTLWRSAAGWQGCNTDGVGLCHDLNRLGVDLVGARILIVGAGGAVRGVLQPLLAAGCRQLRIVNRTEARARQLVAHFADLAGHCQLESGSLVLAAQDGGWDLVINATASGLQGEAPHLPTEGVFRTGAWAYDMLYGTEPTPFLTLAADAGAQTADGLGMLVAQAAESFRLWRNVRPPVEPVLHTLRAAMLAGLPADAALDTYRPDP